MNLTNCDIKDFNVQAYNEETRKTYTEVNFDENSNLGIVIPENYALEHITINSENPKNHGHQTTYKGN